MEGPASCVITVICVLVQLFLGWKSGNAFILIVT